MTDLQILTIAISIVLPVSMLLHSNSRISDAKETLQAEIKELRTEMKAGFEQFKVRETDKDRQARINALLGGS